MIKDIEKLELYHQLGEFEIKVAFNGQPKSGTFSVRDSSGAVMKTSHRVWGNKMKCFFFIDDSTPDGVAAATVTAFDEDGKNEKNFFFWVVK